MEGSTTYLRHSKGNYSSWLLVEKRCGRGSVKGKVQESDPKPPQCLNSQPQDMHQDRCLPALLEKEVVVPHPRKDERENPLKADLFLLACSRLSYYSWLEVYFFAIDRGSLEVACLHTRTGRKGPFLNQHSYSYMIFRTIMRQFDPSCNEPTSKKKKNLPYFTSKVSPSDTH